MTIYCRKHQKMERVLEFVHGDPILECGNVKNRTRVDDRVMECRNSLNKYIISWAIAHGLSIEEVTEEAILYFLGLMMLSKCYGG